MRASETKNSIFLKAVTVTVSFIIFSYLTYGLYRLYDERWANTAAHSAAELVSIERLRLLTETSAAIMHSYYVDQDRVGGVAMLELVMEKLAETEVISVARTAGGNWHLRDGKRSLLVLAMEVDAAHFAKELTRIALWLGESSEFAARYDLQRADDGIYYLLNELLEGLDSHSALLNSEEYNELKQGTEGQFGGIGILVGIRNDLLTVIKPLPNSPASRAGIKKLDRIINIDGRNTFEFSLDQLVRHMRGDPDTRVTLSLLNSGDVSPRQVKIRREVVQVDSINTRQLKAGKFPVLYVQIENFSIRTAEEIAAALDNFRRDIPHRYGVVLDLRGNPGGLLDQAVQVADLFVSHGRILSTTGRREEIEKASYTQGETDYPLVVLIDTDSASASEIVAGALQDQQRAFIIGQPSFGKGSVQTIFELPYGQALKLTIARYFTPKGRSIQDTGIYPDIWMQPVTRHEDNHNLFGAYRYRNYMVTEQSEERTVAHSFYMLTPEEDEYDGIRDDDAELDVSLALLAPILSLHRYGSIFSTQRYRQLPASVLKLLQRDSKEVERWLLAQHQIDWSGSEDWQQDFSLQLNPGTHMQEIIAGEVLRIPYHLRNLSVSPLTRVSLFCRADFHNFKSEEYLLGKVVKKTSAAVDFKIPAATRPGVYQVEIGAALNGIVQQQSIQRFRVKVLPFQPPSLGISASLEAERGGQADGILEAGEYGDVVIVIANHSEVVAKDLTVKVLNLAGRQLRLLKEQQQLPNIAPGEELSVRFPLYATRKLLSEALHLGITVNSASLQTALKKQYTLLSAIGQKKMGALPPLPYKW